MATRERARPRDKAELLANIDRSWRDLHQSVARFSDGQLTERRDAAGWSAKDHLAHIAMWERATLELLRDGRRQHETLGIDLALYESREKTKFDTINAVLHARGTEWTLSRVRTELENVHRPLVSLLESMTLTDFAKPWSNWEPGTHELPVLIVIDGDCTEHYDDHRRWIEELMDERS